MLIKVCGMTDGHNMEEALKAGADLLGLIFHDPSPRNACHVDPKTISPALMERVVGVFVDKSVDEVEDICRLFKIRMVQLHGDETPEVCMELKEKGYVVYKAWGIDDDFDFDRLEPYKGCVDKFVFDTKTRSRGGSGRQFDWSVLRRYDGEVGYLLSGGIDPADAQRVSRLQLPGMQGIDLNSRFEIAPGIKNIEILKKFVEEL